MGSGSLNSVNDKKGAGFAGDRTTGIPPCQHTTCVLLLSWRRRLASFGQEGRSMAVFSKQWTLLATGTHTVGSPDGAAKDVSAGYNRAWEASYVAEKIRLLIHLTNVGAAGTLTGILQGLRPDAASTSITATDWYNALQTDVYSTTGLHSIVLDMDQLMPHRFVRFQRTVGGNSVVGAIYLECQYNR